jgi:hypothetical protein
MVSPSVTFVTGTVPAALPGGARSPDDEQAAAIRKEKARNDRR